MSTVGALKFNIDTFLNSKGFQQFKANLKESMSLSQRFKSVTGSTLGKLAIGYFSITGLVRQYNKAVEASNYQIEQETKLYTTLRAQNFRDEQIKSIIDMTGELQKLGVVGDEVTLTGAQRLATFRMQESSIKKLLPVMQDMLVKEKGLNGTGQDMEGIASIFAKAMNGQTMVLKRNGIVLSEREEQLLKVGTEEQKVALLAEAVRRSVGEQNKEFLKTPEGKIINAKNRIGDLYETWGMSIRDTRAKFWEFIAENADGIQDMITNVFKAGASFVDTFLGVFRDIKRGFNALPDGAKTAFKVIGGLALAAQFPLVTLVLAIEDVFAAFQGKESFTEDAINALLKFTGTDYRFADLRKGVSDFWKLWTEGADSGIEKITFTTKVLTNMLDIIKGGAGLLQMIWGVSGGIVTDTFRAIRGSFTGDFENVGEGTIGNIKAGWNRMNNAYDNIQETYYMYEKNELEEYAKEQKQLIERLNYINKNQNTFGVPVEKDFIIPGSQPLGVSTSINNYKKNNEAIKVELPTNINEAINNLNEAQRTKNIDSKVVDATKKITTNQTVNYNPTYKTDVTINESKDGKNGFEDIVKVLIEKDKENLERIKAQAGMGFLF
jgi:hypothetical protein